MRKKIPVISDRTIEKLEGMNKELVGLYYDNKFSMDTIYNKLIGDKKPFEKVLVK